MSELLYELITSEDAPSPFIVGNGLLPVKGKCIFGGPPKANKSWILLNMALDLAAGRPLWGAASKTTHAPIFPVYKKNKVLFLEQEMGRQGTKDRIRAMVNEETALGLDLHFCTRNVAFRMDTTEGKNLIESEVAAVGPDVIFADPMVKFHGANEDSSQEIGNILRFADFLIEKYNTAFVWSHHTGKQNFENPKRGGDRLRGSSAIFGDADSIVLVNRKSSESAPEPIIELTFEFRRAEPMMPKYFKRRKSGLISFIGDSMIPTTEVASAAS